jgi:hypothetical protein
MRDVRQGLAVEVDSGDAGVLGLLGGLGSELELGGLVFTGARLARGGDLRLGRSSVAESGSRSKGWIESIWAKAA